MVWDDRRRGRKRISQWLPRREKFFYFRRGPHIWLLKWKPFVGIRLVAERLGDYSAQPHTTYSPEVNLVAIKKRLRADGLVTPVTGAKPNSVILGKLPALREFLCTVVYDDGSPRQCGDLSIRTRNLSWICVLRDPDAGARLTVSADDLDKCLLLLEQLVGVEEAPWERDDWLTAQLLKKKKK